MIHTSVVTNDLKIMTDVPMDRLTGEDVKWFWVDFDVPSEEESALLKSHFNFHHLAIEDCFHLLQRPKLDYYDGYVFFVLHTLNTETLSSEEVDIFIGHSFIVTFHSLPSPHIETVRQRKMMDETTLTKGVMHIFYLIMDKIVDEYFPIMYKTEDALDQLDNQPNNKNFIEELFEIRSRLTSLRRSIFPMRELLYRILNSERLDITKDERVYFMDIDDHLLRLSEMIESNREITVDMRESYMSLNSNRMNSIMKTLTVITSVFIPLTFIAGVYGMNFQYMPELTWRWGYFGVLGFMVGVGFAMSLWLWFKGWFK